VLLDEKGTPLPGCYAAGECACVSVHGANRLGTNSLVDILVFGRRAARHIGGFLQGAYLPSLPAAPEADARDRLAAILARPAGESAPLIREALQQEMMDKVSVFRDAAGLRAALDTLHGLKERYRNIAVADKGKCFNTELMEAIEVGFLLDLAEATAVAALARTESRGAHCREDFPQRDDAAWLKHSLAFKTPAGFDLRYKPVTITRFQPKARVY